MKQDRKVRGALKAAVRNRYVCLKVHNSLHGVVELTSTILTYGSETQTLLKGQKLRVRTEEMGYIQGARGVTRRDRHDR